MQALLNVERLQFPDTKLAYDLAGNAGMTTGQPGVLAADTNINQTNINIVGLASTGLEYI